MDSIVLNNYHNLNKERIMVEKAILKNNTLNAAFNDSEIIVNTRYYEYIALLFVAVLLIFLFFRFNTNGMQSGGGKNYCNIGLYKLALAIIFIVFYMNRYKFY